MRLLSGFSLLACVLGAVCVGVSYAQANAALAADLQTMMKLFEGEFDNYAQAWEEKEQKAEHPHEHIHSIFARVKLPAFGENVFYVKQYMDGDPAKVYRTRLYCFAANEKEGAVELRIYSFPDEKAVNDAQLDQSKLAGLVPEKMGYYNGCEVYWKRDGEGFNGYMKKDACKVESKRSGRTLVITDDLKLTKDQIWIRDEAKDTQGNYVYGHKAGIHHKLNRCRYFDGWAALRIAETGDDQKDYLGFMKLRMHDQGQFLRMTKPDGETTKYRLQLAQLVQQGSKVPVMVLKIFEDGKDQAVSYAWTEPESKRIGLNLRWFQSGFTFKP